MIAGLEFRRIKKQMSATLEEYDLRDWHRWFGIPALATGMSEI